MKVVSIRPCERSSLYGNLVKREAAIRKKGLGTFSRSGRKKRGSAIWKHKRFRGSINLKRERDEVVTARIRSTVPEDERRLLSSFLGFIDRNCGGQVRSITIDYH